MKDMDKLKKETDDVSKQLRNALDSYYGWHQPHISTSEILKSTIVYYKDKIRNLFRKKKK